MDNSNEDEFEEFSEAMGIRNLVAKHDGNKVKITVSQEYGNSDLFEIEAFVKQIIATEELAFEQRQINPFAKMWYKLSLEKYYHQVHFFTAIYQEDFSYSPHIELFYSTIFEFLGPNPSFCIDPYLSAGIDRPDAEAFNELILRIRAKANSIGFKKKVKARKYNLSRNEKNATSYINKLFEIFSRLMVVRIDFFFEKHRENGISVSEARSYLSRFLNNKRNNGTFKDLVGYIWKLEDGKIKGPHFHCLFFFDGSKAHKHAFAGMQIGEYWKDITNGKGRFYNVNANHQIYLSKNVDIGIGMVNYYEFQKRIGLMYIVKYFFKNEQYLSAKSLKKLRTYGHGELPTATTSGRPRAKTAEAIPSATP